MDLQDVHSFEEYLGKIEQNEHEVESLLDSLNNTYTEFFREPITSTLLQKQILPDIIFKKKQKSQMRIWVAGCSTGQEAYTIAIEISEAIKKSGKEIRCTFFATDKSLKALKQAEDAIYTYEQVQEVKFKYINEYFDPVSEGYKINDNLRECIRFSYYDMLESGTLNPPDCVYGDFDIISCCNMLIYYNSCQRNKIVGKILNSMSNESVLITSESERMIFENKDELKSVTVSSSVFFKSRES
jgi:chemotaxis methyl-accepting protein methylase